MFAYMIRFARRGADAVLGYDTPHQLAAGFVLGMLLGLVPKGNLIALSLCVLLFSMRVNTGLGLVAAVVFSWIGPLADSFADKLGWAVLSAEPLQATYAAVYRMPLGPWLGFENTVVTGSLLLGLYLMYPLYWACYFACDSWRSSGRATSLDLPQPAATHETPVTRRAA